MQKCPELQVIGCITECPSHFEFNHIKVMKCPFKFTPQEDQNSNLILT